MEKQKILDNVWIRTFLVFCAIALFFAICYLLKGILISLFLAFTIAYIFDPLVDYISTRRLFFTKKHIPRGLAIVLMLISMVLVIGGLLTYTVPKTVNGIQHVGVALKKQYPKYQGKIEKIFEEYKDTEIGIFLKSQLGIKEAKEEEKKQLEKPETKDVKQKRSDEKKFLIPKSFLELKKYIPSALKLVFGIAKNVFQGTFGFIGIVMNIVIFGVVTVYLLKDFDKIISKGRALIPVSRKEKISDIMRRIDENLKSFFRGQITVCIILSIIYGIGLTAIGVPMSFLIAIAGGFGNIIPYIGITLGLVPALVLTFIQYQDVTHLVLVGVVFGIGQFFEGTLITPKIVGTKLGLNPVAIIISILIFSQLLGFLGLLLAVPLLSVIKVLIDEGFIKYKNSNLL